MNNLSILLKSAAAFMTLTVLAQDIKAQSCPACYFCSRLSTANATKIGYHEYTVGLDGWDGVYHYYLRQDVVASESIDFSGVGSWRSLSAATGNLSAHITYLVDLINSSPEYLSQSWTSSSSVTESGAQASYNGPIPFSITGTIGGMYYLPEENSALGGWDWNLVGWGTTNTFDGNPSTHYGVFSAIADPRNNDLDDFSICFADGIQTFTCLDTVKNNDWVYNYSDSLDYVNDSYTETMTLSVPYTDELLATIINAKASSFTSGWTDPPASLRASFTETTNEDGTVSGSGARMQYRVAVPASEKGANYRFKWFEVTRDSGGKVLSNPKRTCTVVGTGDPANPALGDIFDVPVPSQPGATTVAENLEPDNEITTTPPLPKPPVHFRPPITREPIPLAAL